MSERGRIPLFSAILMIVTGMSLALRVAPYQVDDAFITYRYARNIVDGHGLAFNPGDAWVEGFSSPVWLLLCTLWAAIHSPTSLPTFTLVLGLASYVLCAMLVWRTATRVSPHAAWAGVAALAVLVCSPTATYYAVTGLETPLFACVVSASVAAASIAATSNTGLRRIGVGAFAIAASVRPEAPWLVVGSLVQRAWARRDLLGPPMLASIVAVVLGCVGVVLMRWWLFDSLLPNTWFAKQPSWSSGVTYVVGTCAQPWATALLLAATAGASLGTAEHRGFAGAGVAWLLAAVVDGGDWMPVGRLLLPAWVAFALAASGCMEARGRTKRVCMWLLAATAALQIHASWMRGDRANETFDRLRHEAIVVADWIAASGAQSVALVDIGELGFRTPLSILDLAGLTDASVARSEGGHLDKRLDLDELLARRHPDVIVVRLSRVPDRDELGRWQAHPHDAMSAIELRVLQNATFRRHYQPWLLQLPKDPRVPLYARAIFKRRSFIPTIALGERDTLVVAPRP